MDAFILFLKGIFMGVANIIPGVSGGTLAISLNIFDSLIWSINNLFKDFKKSMNFLLPVFLGIGFGILAFSSLIEYGLENYSFSTSMLFVGLIVGSIPLIYKKATEKGSTTTDYVLAVVVFLALSIFSIQSFRSNSASTSMLVPSTSTFVSVLRFFFIGVIASSAMVVPGISGSFIFMVLGVYNQIISSISNLLEYLKDLSNVSILFDSLYVLVPTGLGVVVGIFLISKIVGVLLEKAQTKLYFVVLGLIFGSVFAMFCNPATYISGFNTFGIILGAIFFGIGVIISRKLGGK